MSADAFSVDYFVGLEDAADIMAKLDAGVVEAKTCPSEGMNKCFKIVCELMLLLWRSQKGSRHEVPRSLRIVRFMKTKAEVQLSRLTQRPG